MIYFVLMLVCYTLNGVIATDSHNKTGTCNTTVTNMKNEIVNFTEYGTDKPCLMKCCGENEILVYNKTSRSSTCTNITNNLENDLKESNITLDYSDLKLYKSDINAKELNESDKKILRDFNLVQIKAIMDENCGRIWRGTKPYILDNGKLVLDMKNQNSQGWETLEEQFCVERMVERTSLGVYRSTYSYYFMVEDNRAICIRANQLNYAGVASLISSFFLLLVLLVYCALPQLRNLAGMLLMAYVATLLAAYLTKAIVNFIGSAPSLCKVVSPMIYFLFQSSFLWLNIMSYDMWYIFSHPTEKRPLQVYGAKAKEKVVGYRSIGLNRPLYRRSDVAKFLWYGLYAWGVAATMTIIAITIDNSTLKNWPHIIKPGFSICFRNGEANLLYHYTPLAILTSINIVFFLMTVYNIWLIKNGLKSFSSSTNNKNNNIRFRLYLRMSLLMGVSWALEVLQSFLGEVDVWLYVLLTMYNACIGVAIFFIFIFNMSTLYMLCKRFKIESAFVEDWKTKSLRTTISRPSTNKGSYIKKRTTDATDV